MANGEILEALKEKIESELKKRNLKKSDRAILEIQQLFVIYLQSDHQKIGEIYPYVVEQKALNADIQKQRRESGLYYLRLTIGTALTALVMLLVNGFIYFVKILPVMQQLAEQR